MKKGTIPKTPNTTPTPADRKTARRLHAGLTLVPYRAYNEQGRLTWYSRWVKLSRGESLSQAATRLSVPPKPF